MNENKIIFIEKEEYCLMFVYEMIYKEYKRIKRSRYEKELKELYLNNYRERLNTYQEILKKLGFTWKFKEIK
jgi:hypothetical protein